MSPALKRLAADMLSQASEKYSRAICNDWRWPKGLALRDRKALTVAVNALGSPEDAHDHAADRVWGPMDWCVMIALANMLRAEEDALKARRHALAEALLGIEATTVEEYRDRAHALAMNWKLEE